MNFWRPLGRLRRSACGRFQAGAEIGFVQNLKAEWDGVNNHLRSNVRRHFAFASSSRTISKLVQATGAVDFWSGPNDSRKGLARMIGLIAGMVSKSVVRVRAPARQQVWRHGATCRLAFLSKL
jgi:hypothetical protein